MPAVTKEAADRVGKSRARSERSTLSGPERLRELVEGANQDGFAGRSCSGESSQQRRAEIGRLDPQPGWGGDRTLLFGDSH